MVNERYSPADEPEIAMEKGNVAMDLGAETKSYPEISLVNAPQGVSPE